MLLAAAEAPFKACRLFCGSVSTGPRSLAEAEPAIARITRAQIHFVVEIILRVFLLCMRTRPTDCATLRVRGKDPARLQPRSDSLLLVAGFVDLCPIGIRAGVFRFRLKLGGSL